MDLLVVAGLVGVTRALQRDSVRRLLSLRLLLLLSLGVGRRFHGFACLTGVGAADCVHHIWLGRLRGAGALGNLGGSGIFGKGYRGPQGLESPIPNAGLQRRPGRPAPASRFSRR